MKTSDTNNHVAASAADREPLAAPHANNNHNPILGLALRALDTALRVFGLRRPVPTEVERLKVERYRARPVLSRSSEYVGRSSRVRPEKRQGSPKDTPFRARRLGATIPADTAEKGGMSHG